MISASDWILKANLSTSTVDQYTKVLFSSTRNTSSCDSLGDGCNTLVEKDSDFASDDIVDSKTPPKTLEQADIDFVSETSVLFLCILVAIITSSSSTGTCSLSAYLTLLTVFMIRESRRLQSPGGVGQRNPSAVGQNRIKRL